MNTQRHNRLLLPVRFMAVLSVVLMLSGCSELARRFPGILPQEQIAGVEKPGQLADIPEPEPDFTHIVTWSGESLSVISTWYTGKVTNWRAIAAANPQLDPNRIFIGDTVVIPNDLLVTQKDMPEAFVHRFTNHPKSSVSAPKSSVPPMDTGTGDGGPSSGPAIGDMPEGTASGSPDDRAVENGIVSPEPDNSGDADAFKLFGPKE